MSESASHFRLPFELIEGDEHHGPYITNNYGSNVCDFYTMSNPSALSVRNGGDSKPIWFADAKDNAAFMLRAVNAHEALVAALRPFAAVAEHDIGSTETDDDQFIPIRYHRAPLLKVGDLRRALAALKLADGQQ